jgi:hypothetical protein
VSRLPFRHCRPSISGIHPVSLSFAAREPESTRKRADGTHWGGTGRGTEEPQKAGAGSMKMVTRHYVSCKVKSGRPRLPSRQRMDEERRTPAPKGDVVMRSAEPLAATTWPVSAGHGGDGAVELVHSHCGHSLALVGQSRLECCFYCLTCCENVYVPIEVLHRVTSPPRDPSPGRGHPRPAGRSA